MATTGKHETYSEFTACKNNLGVFTLYLCCTLVMEISCDYICSVLSMANCYSDTHMVQLDIHSKSFTAEKLYGWQCLYRSSQIWPCMSYCSPNSFHTWFLILQPVHTHIPEIYSKCCSVANVMKYKYIKMYL